MKADGSGSAGDAKPEEPETDSKRGKKTAAKSKAGK